MRNDDDDYLIFFCDYFDEIHCRSYYKLFEYVANKTNGIFSANYTLKPEQVARMKKLLNFGTIDIIKNDVNL